MKLSGLSFGVILEAENNNDEDLLCRLFRAIADPEIHCNGGGTVDLSRWDSGVLKLRLER